MLPAALRRHLRAGQVIPALPLALRRNRRWDEPRQRALVRYYLDAGAGGLAVGVHSTQFAIRDPKIALYTPVLRLAAATASAWLASTPPERSPTPARPFALIAGLCGRTPQALAEARTARDLGYHAGLLSLGAWHSSADTEKKILAHCRTVARAIPLIGFYLQPAVGGRLPQVHEPQPAFGIRRRAPGIPAVGTKLADPVVQHLDRVRHVALPR